MASGGSGPSSLLHVPAVSAPLSQISEEKRVSRATTGAFMGGLAAPEGMPSHLTSARSAAEVETLLAEQLFRARHVVQILRVAEQSGAMFSANNLATALYRAAGLGLRVRSGGVPVLPPVLSTVAGPHDPDAAVHGLLERSLAKVPLMRPRDAAVMAYAVSLMGVGTETTTFPARGYRSARRGAAAVPWEIAGDGGPDERAKEGELAGDRDDQADRPGSSPPGGPIGERRVGGSASLVYSLRDALLDRLEAIVGDGAPAAESDVMAEAARVWPGAVDAPHSRRAFMSAHHAQEVEGSCPLLCWPANPSLGDVAPSVPCRSVPVYPSPQKSLARLADVVREVQRSGGCPALAAVPEWDVWGGFSLEEAALEPCLERSSLGLAAGAVARLSAAGKRRGLKAMLAAEACWAAERGNIDNRTLATVLAWSR